MVGITMDSTGSGTRPRGPSVTAAACPDNPRFRLEHNRVSARSMKARQFLQNAVHKPETLQVVFAAFDAAWAELENDFPERTARDEARQQLARALLAVVTSDTTDPLDLKERALKAMKPPLISQA